LLHNKFWSKSILETRKTVFVASDQWKPSRDIIIYFGLNISVTKNMIYNENINAFYNESCVHYSCYTQRYCPRTILRMHRWWWFIYLSGDEADIVNNNAIHINYSYQTNLACLTTIILHLGIWQGAVVADLFCPNPFMIST
jgi:hypothetical protein